MNGTVCSFYILSPQLFFRREFKSVYKLFSTNMNSISNALFLLKYWTDGLITFKFSFLSQVKILVRLNLPISTTENVQIFFGGWKKNTPSPPLLLRELNICFCRRVLRLLGSDLIETNSILYGFISLLLSSR